MMKQRSYFFKLFLGNLLLVVAIIGISFTVSYYYLNAEYRARQALGQENTARLMQKHFESCWQRESHSIDDQCKNLMKDMSDRLTVIDRNGRVLGDSQAAPSTMENHNTADRSEVVAALKGQAGTAIRRSDTLGVSFRYVARPLHHNGELVGLVRLARPVEDLVTGQTAIRNILARAALVAICVAVVLSILLSWLRYVPVRQTIETARSMAVSDLAGQLPAAGLDEMSELSAILRQMHKNLADQLDQIVSQRANLAAVLSNLREGILGLDDERNIVLMNSSAVSLLAHEPKSPSEVIGRNIQSVVRVPEILEVLARLRPDQTISSQIEIGKDNRKLTLDLHMAALSEAGRAGISTLLVVRDVTEQVRTAEMKAEFVANASHELRTPLATIRAAVDSMASVDPADAEGFRKLTDILDRHTKRLEEMTKDLLDLHRVEQPESKFQMEDIRLSSLAERVRNEFSSKAEDKGVVLKVCAEDSETQVRSDLTLVTLILKNLVDNALKFTPAGGEVRCRLQNTGDNILLEIADTGCGIPADIHDRVFERFFQSDPSRSGQNQARGTGLGLAIVKHAVSRLEGSIELQSKPGQGTSIRVTIPRLST